MRSQVWKRLVGKNTHGNICHCLVTKLSSIFNARRSTSFQILYCVLERSIKIRNPTKLGRKRKNGSHLFIATETLTESMESRQNSRWNIFPGFDTLQLYGKVKDLLSRLGETPENFTGRILFMSMFDHISCGTKDNEEKCLANAKGRLHFCQAVPKRSGIL